MASSDIGATARTGPFSRITPAGSGPGVSSNQAFSETPLSVTVNNSDACDIGVTLLPSTNSVAVGGVNIITGPIYYYKMRGMDHNVSGLYDTWTVVGSPDYAAASYVGALALPLRDVVISATWGI